MANILLQIKFILVFENVKTLFTFVVVTCDVLKSCERTRYPTTTVVEKSGTWWLLAQNSGSLFLHIPCFFCM